MNFLDAEREVKRLYPKNPLVIACREDTLMIDRIGDTIRVSGNVMVMTNHGISVKYINHRQTSDDPRELSEVAYDYENAKTILLKDEDFAPYVNWIVKDSIYDFINEVKK